MADLRTLVRDEMERAGSPSYSFDDLDRRRDRKRRNKRIAAGAVGIAVFVGAVWIVTNFGSLDRSQTSVIPGPAETGPAETAPPPAPVTPRWVFGQRALPCSDGARSILKLWVDARIKVRFEVQRSPVGHEWRIELAHPSLTDDDRKVFFRGTRVASDSGELVVHERVSDSTIERRPAGATVQGGVYPDPGYWAEPGVFLAKAVDTQTGQICRVYMGP